MIVDEDRLAIGVVHRVASEMIFADRRRRQVPEPRLGIEPQIVRRDDDVVGIKQQAAAGPAGEFGHELGFGKCRIGERQVAGRIFDKHLPAQTVLQPFDIARDHLQCLFRIRQWQQVVEVTATGHAPGKMLGDERRLETIGQCRHTIQMRVVEAVDGSERQADRVNGELVVPAQELDGPQRWRVR